MRACQLAFVILLVFLAMDSPRAQTEDQLSALKNQAQQLYRDGKYAEALDVQRRVAIGIEKMEKAASGSPGTRTAEALDGLAWHALFARKFDEAVAAAQRAHELAPDQLGIEINRAHALLLQGRVDDARAIYLAHKGKRASPNDDKAWEDTVADDFETLRKSGINHAAFDEIAAALNVDIALTRSINDLYRELQRLYRAGKYAEATPLAEKYVALARERYGNERSEVATAMVWLAAVYTERGRFAEAEQLYKHSLAIREKVFGREHAVVASSLNDLAILYETQGRYADSEKLKKRALAIREKALGPDHVGVAESLNNLAFLYESLGRYNDAEPLYRRSLRIKEKALGSESPSVATALNNLAIVYQSQARYTEAETLLRRALAIREKALGAEHPDVGHCVGNLAGLLIAMGRLGKQSRFVIVSFVSWRKHYHLITKMLPLLSAILLSSTVI